MSDAEQDPLFGVASRSLEDGSLAMLERYGVELPWDDPDFPRMDYVQLENEDFDLLRARPMEMPESVAAGDAVMGITCTDGLFESYARGSVTTVRNLGFGVCTMALLVPDDSPITRVDQLVDASIATSYPRATGDFFSRQGVSINQIRKRDGCVEAMPYVPVSRADAIVDLVQSGTSMRANRLRTLANLGQTQAVLIENPQLVGRYDDVFRRFVERIIPIQREQTYPSDIPDQVRDLDRRLAVPPEQMDEQSQSRKLLTSGVEGVNRKLGEESFEVLQAFLGEEDDALIDEAQSTVWLVAVGLRARGIELGRVLPNAIFDPGVAQKGNKQNDAIRSFGDAMNVFGNTMLRGSAKEVAKAGAGYIGALDNLLSLRFLNMAQVYERL